MNKECNNHPKNFDSYTPEEFAKKFVKTNYFYQEQAFKEMIKEYKKEFKGDKKANKIQLANGLEKVIKSISSQILEGFEEIGKACKKYMKNPYNNI
ncbi:MAG: hypothetical protein U9Q99_02380 [Nanoarchaeota archaeon]|nr:hypothetical protein [Nanoarchaeota archaeon]